jgi:H+/Cl- antiporter ClcA
MPFSPIRFRARRWRATAWRWARVGNFVAGGVCVGIAAVGLAYAADGADHAFRTVLSASPVLALVLTPAGFALSSWLTRSFFPTSGGSGIPQTIAARHLSDPVARRRLVSLRGAGGKILLLLLGLGCGASIGREGPTVQVGAAIMLAMGRFAPRRQSGLILAGASAGVAAAFNTPLAGIVFGIEEMSRSFETRTSRLVIGGVIAAGLTSLALQGDYTYFGVTSAALGGSLAGWAAVPILGVAGGLLGGAFSRVLILFGAGLPGRAGALIRRHHVIFAALCGLVVALCGFLSHGEIFGTGYAQASGLVQGQAGVSEGFDLLKLLATLASSVSGIPGGIFAPSLAVGAGLGASCASWLTSAPAQALVLMGMVAYFSGVVQAPITSFVIVTEMTGNHALVVPLMLASLIGYGVSRLVCPEGVYHALARNYLPGPDLPRTHSSSGRRRAR